MPAKKLLYFNETCSQSPLTTQSLCGSEEKALVLFILFLDLPSKFFEVPMCLFMFMFCLVGIQAQRSQPSQYTAYEIL